MEVNIISVMLGAEIALERMRKAGKPGQIINTASMAGMGPGLSEKMTAYTVSKEGVNKNNDYDDQNNCNNNSC